MSVTEHLTFTRKTEAKKTMSAPPPPTSSSCRTLTPSSGKYCACEFPSSTKLFSYRGFIPDLITCQCGETPASSQCEWLWDNANTAALSDDAPLISSNGKDILFHPSYSHGTAIVRGNQALSLGRVHYWEMRILTMPSGTAVMFGIGSDQLQLNAFQFHFISALGTNCHSWGYSYQGQVQHMGIQRKYGQPISQGSIVGVLVDLTHGYLEFYLNRRSLGIAYTNIPTSGGVKLYPMVCSTAARSCVRLIGATSAKDCLQYRCLAALSEQAGFTTNIQQQLPPGMQSLLREYWFLALTEKRGALGNRSTQCGTNKRQGCAGYCSKCDKHEGGNNLTSLLVQTERVMRSSQRLVRKQKFRNTKKSRKELLPTQIEESEGADDCAAAAEAEIHEDEHGSGVQRKRQVSADLDDAAYHGYFHYML